jgi:hypothetical protein
MTKAKRRRRRTPKAPLSPEGQARVEADRKRRKEESKAQKERGRDRAEWIAMNKAVLPERD